MSIEKMSILSKKRRVKIFLGTVKRKYNKQQTFRVKTSCYTAKAGRELINAYRFARLLRY